MFVASLQTQMRVIGALIVRELHTRYGREHLGFLWLMGEPLMFAAGVIVMWRLLSGPYVHDVPIVPLTLLGYIPLLLYRHMVNGSVYFLRRNSPLLFHRQVTIQGLYLSRVATEMAGNILAFYTTYFVLYQFGQLELPANIGLLYLGYFYNAWWSAATTAILMPLSERNELVEKLWLPLSYMQLPICGAYIAVQWVPADWREWYLLWPSVHAYEMIRAGYFGTSFPSYWNQIYIALWCGVLTFVGLWLLRGARKYISFE